MHALLLAVAVTPTPVEKAVERLERQEVLPVIREYWIAMGVLEEDEWYLQSVWSMDYDITIMNNRMDITPPDAPPLTDRHFLPDANTALANYHLGCEFERFLDDQKYWVLDGEERNELNLILADCRRRQELWYMVYRCGSTSVGTEGRRFWLNELRKQVGADTFYGHTPFEHPLPRAADGDPFWAEWPPLEPYFGG